MEPERDPGQETDLGVGAFGGAVGDAATTIEGNAYPSFIPHDMRSYSNPNKGQGNCNGHGNS